ncbi:hypothetical protein NL676_038482 [Syzygium grande]|nr:hypothetical protein NL676_038482 [Syzygium grande]
MTPSTWPLCVAVRSSVLCRIAIRPARLSPPARLNSLPSTQTAIACRADPALPDHPPGNPDSASASDPCAAGRSISVATPPSPLSHIHPRPSSCSSRPTHPEMLPSHRHYLINFATTTQLPFHSGPLPLSPRHCTATPYSTSYSLLFSASLIPSPRLSPPWVAMRLPEPPICRRRPCLAICRRRPPDPNDMPARMSRCLCCHRP